MVIEGRESNSISSIHVNSHLRVTSWLEPLCSPLQGNAKDISTVFVAVPSPEAIQSSAIEDLFYKALSHFRSQQLDLTPCFGHCSPSAGTSLASVPAHLPTSNPQNPDKH